MIRATGLAILAFFAAGCAVPPGEHEIQPAVGQVDAVWLRVPVSPLATVGEGAAKDAVAMEVICFGHQGAGMPVSGSLEVIFFEGGLAAEDVSGAKPFHVVAFPNSFLRGEPNPRMHEGYSPFFGVSYRGVVPWGPKAPSGPKITVVARYIPPAGTPVLSDPTVVTIRSPT